MFSGEKTAGVACSPVSLMLTLHSPRRCRILSVSHLDPHLIFPGIAVPAHLINIVGFSLLASRCVEILVLRINLHNPVPTYFSDLSQ